MWRPNVVCDKAADENPDNTNNTMPTFNIGPSSIDSESVSIETSSLKDSKGDELRKTWKPIHIGRLSDATQNEKWECVVLISPCPVISISWRQYSRYLPTGWTPNVLLSSSADRVCRFWIEMIKPPPRGTIMEGGTVTGVKPNQWKYETTEFPSTITLRVNQHSMDQTLDDAFSRSTQSTFALPKVLLYHPVMRHLLQLWLTDPFSNVQISIEPAFSEEGLRIDRLTSFTSAQPRFAFATSLNVDNFHGLPPGSTRRYIHGLDMSVPNPAGIQMQYLPIVEENSRRSSVESAFTMTPNLGSRLSQVTSSLRSRLHEAFPVGEAASMLPQLFIFLTSTPNSRYSLQMLQMETSSDLQTSRDVSTLFCRLLVLHNALQMLSPSQSIRPGDIFSDNRQSLRQTILTGLAETQLLWSTFDTKVHRAQYVAMITRHTNGSLRYWRLDVSESSHFQWIVSVNGSARLSGHRFHTEAIVPHPLLPLVLTSSHFARDSLSSYSESKSESHSELILWCVGPVGPLTSSTGFLEHQSKHCHHSSMNKTVGQTVQLSASDIAADVGHPIGTASQGGLFEVARLDVSCGGEYDAWFDDLAWFPCMLTTSPTPYPVGLFLSNVSEPRLGKLGFFLALTEASEVKLTRMDQNHVGDRSTNLAHSDTSGSFVKLCATLPLSERVESKERASGMQLRDPQTLLLHVFPSELIPGTQSDQSRMQEVHSVQPNRHSTYLIIRLTQWKKYESLEPKPIRQYTTETQLEMWRVNVRTEAGPSVNSSVQPSFDELLMNIERLCDCTLPLPAGVSILRAEVSAAHVSWAALSTCSAPPPYLIVSACSDGCLRFWRCDTSFIIPNITMSSHTPILPNCVWSEWQMPLTHALSSSIELTNHGRTPLVLDIDCAYSGRVAVAYALLPSSLEERSLRSSIHHPSKSLAIIVAIYECESSGGCEWILEDTIDLTAEWKHNQLHHKESAVVQLDWVSTEDGGHLLSVMLGARVLVFMSTCRNVSAGITSSNSAHQITPATLMTTLGEVYLSWSLIAATRIHSPEVSIEVGKATVGTQLHPVPCGRHRQAIWLRDGLLLIGVGAEMHVYSQWPSQALCSLKNISSVGATKAERSNKNSGNREVEVVAHQGGSGSTDVHQSDHTDDSAITGTASMTVAQLTRTYSAYLLKPSPSSALLGSTSSTTRQKQTVSFNTEKTCGRERQPVIEAIDPSLLANVGLFESIQIFSPVLPQFHPRQLLEWMNLGRLRRVQAIMAHLTRCLIALSPQPGNVGPSMPPGTPSCAPRKSFVGSSINLSNTRTPDANCTGRPSAAGASVTGNACIQLEPQAIPPVPLYVLLALDSLNTEGLVGLEDEKVAPFDAVNEITPVTPTDEVDIFRIQDESGGEETDEFSTPTSRIKPESAKDKLRPTKGADSRSSFGGLSMWSLKPSVLVAMSQFKSEDAKLLTEYLTTRQLPGLSPLDQMYLLGIADLMANTQSTVTDRFSRAQSSVATSSMMTKQHLVKETPMRPAGQDLDECGLRFVLTVQLYSYLSRTLPPARRTQLMVSGLNISSLAWAFHSDAEEELLNRIPIKEFQTGGGQLTWTEFKRYGCGWWIRSEAMLRRCIENIAKNAFQTTKDPMESIVFYAAMQKPKVVAGLFKSIGDRVKEKFFRSDFLPGSAACRQAKLNAYRLLGQHRYPQAAGLFLLAGCLDDAVRVCLDMLKDLQMAVVLVRLYTSCLPGSDNLSADSSFRKFLEQHLITHDDPFIRSMAYWTLRDPLAALHTLLVGPIPGTEPTDSISNRRPSGTASSTSVTESHSPQRPQTLVHMPSLAGSSSEGNHGENTRDSTKEIASNSVYPSVFKFYTFLRSHPLVLRQLRLNAPTTTNRLALRRLTSLERRLYFRTAHHYSAMRCPTLALEVLSKIPPLLPAVSASMRSDSFETTVMNITGRDTSSHVTLKPTQSQPHTNDDIFDWSAGDAFEQRCNDPNEDAQFSIESMDDDSDVDRDSITGREHQPMRVSNMMSYESKSDLPLEEDEGIVDLIANQLKFIACLKILSEELCTLAAGAETEGVGLRQHVWHWLEHELAVVRALTAVRPATQSSEPPLTVVPNPDHRRPSTQLLIDQLMSLHIGEVREIGSDPVDDAVGRHACSMNRGPLTTPSFILTTVGINELDRDNSNGFQSPSGTSINANTASPAVLLNTSVIDPSVSRAELNRLRVRRQWLESHEAFLTSLINFCGLYGTSGVGLPAVRIELLYLLTELHTYPTCPAADCTDAFAKQDSMVSTPTVWPTATAGLVDGIPLLRTMLHLPPGSLLLPDPVNHIKCMINDLMTCLETLPPPYLTTAILPYPHVTDMECPGTAATNKDGTDAYVYCAQCAWAPTPHRQRRVFLLRNLCASLAVCMHQSLSTGGWFGPGETVREGGIALPASSLMTARSIDRLLSSNQLFQPNTEPSRWPGLTTLRNYIHVQQRPSPRIQPVASTVSVPKLATSSQTASSSSTVLTTMLHSVNRRHLVGLLAQALAATYLGLIVYALHSRDTCALYRLVAARLDASTWSRVFGGAYRAKPFRPAAPPGIVNRSIPSPAPRRPPPPQKKPMAPLYPPTSARNRKLSDSQSESNTPPELVPGNRTKSSGLAADQLSPIVGTTPPIGRSDTPEADADRVSAAAIVDEWFIPPQCSILTCLLERPFKKNVPPDDPSQIFNSDDSDPPSDYNGYKEALSKQQRRIRRLNRLKLHHQQSIAKRDAQRKAKDDLKRRLAKHTGLLGSSDEEQNEPPIRLEQIYPELLEKAEDSSSNDSLPDVEKQPYWILRLLHLDPDFVDAISVESTGFMDETQLLATSEYDSDVSENSSDGDDDAGGSVSDGLHHSRFAQVERLWASGDSYSWRLMRLGIMQLAKAEINRLTQLLDFGTDDLAVHAPGLVTASHLVDAWMTTYRLGLSAPPALTPHDLAKLSVRSLPHSHLLPPTEFLPELEQDLTGYATADTGDKSVNLPSAGATRAMLRLRHLINPAKTPFQTKDPFSLPVKRLWCYLVRQPNVDDMILRHVFRKPRLVESIIVRGTTHCTSDIVKTSDSSLPVVSGTVINKSSILINPDDTLKSSNSTLGKSLKHPTAQPTAHSSASILYDDAIRLVHKSQDPLIAMCINQSSANPYTLHKKCWKEVNHNCIAIATPKEVIELNVDNLVTLPPWYADEVEYDLELMRQPQPRLYPDGGTDDFIVLDSSSFPVSSSGEPMANHTTGTMGTQTAGGPSSHVFRGLQLHPLHVNTLNLPRYTLERSRRLAATILTRSLNAVYSLASHPTLPYYLSGTGTGSVHLFQWATAVPVIAGFTNTFALTPAGASGHGPAGSRGARVTALKFDDSGRRFGCGDADGNFGLWNLQSTSPDKPPYFRCRCHAKGLADFCFVGSSCLIATVGNGGCGGSSSMASGAVTGQQLGIGESYGSLTGSGVTGASSFGAEQDGSNLTLWDTLLPPRRCAVIRVTDSELDSPCTAVAQLVPTLNSTGWPNSNAFTSNAQGDIFGGLFNRSIGSARDRMVAVGTKRGDVCLVDLRMPRVFHSFTAHDSAVRTLCVDSSTDCLITGGADGNVKVWRLSDSELITNFCGDVHQGRGTAAVAAAALFRGNQSAAMIAATNPGVSQVHLLPLLTGASLLNQGRLRNSDTDPYQTTGIEDQNCSTVAASTACRFLSCGADGGLRMRSFVVRPKPFGIC